MSSRRNGKPASCEPCRKNKTRCDHTLPKCNRCHQRGIADKCFYHPAPLTKPRDGTEVPAMPTDNGHFGHRAKRRRSNEAIQTPDLNGPSMTQNISFLDSVASQTYRPGYLGPTSYVTVLPRDEDLQQSGDRASSVGSEGSAHDLALQYAINKPMRMEMATEALKSLRQIKVIERLVLDYCENNQGGVVAAPLLINSISAIRLTVEEFKLEVNTPSPHLVTTVLENTERPLEISPSTQASQFHTLFTGPNLRLEIIGLMLATAARSLFFGLAPDMWNGTNRRASKPHFTDEMLRSSTACLRLCTQLNAANDLLTWLLYDVLLLTSMMCGDTSPPVWRRLGELATEIFALGIHRESKDSKVPFFILETRRRMFCASYNLDKSISTFLGRPPRLCWRHTDVRLPLELSDEELTADQQTLDEACQALDQHGWNTKEPGYRRVSWIRLRCITSTFREEILDISLGKIDQFAEERLLDISRRCRESWETIPSHLQYKPSSWEEDLPSGACLMMVIVYLTHLYNHFLVQKLLNRRPLCMNTALLSVSMELLSTVVTLGHPRDRTFDVHRDLSYTVLLYGIPSGSVLVTALQKQSRSGEPFPSSISRSEIIRTLSVLISHLESVARPGDGNYTLCRKAAKAFTRIIDGVLDPQASSIRKPSSTMTNEINLGFQFQPGFEGFDTGDVLNLFDNMDWSTINQWSF